MRPIWNTKEWKARRTEFLKDKSCEWCGSKDYLIVHHTQEKGLSDEEYLNFVSAIPLCHRCHLAHHRGMHLCPICKKKYTKYNSCWACLPNQTKERLKQKIMDYVLPCKAIIKINEEEYDFVIGDNTFLICHDNCPKGIEPDECETFRDLAREAMEGSE